MRSMSSSASGREPRSGSRSGLAKFVPGHTAGRDCRTPQLSNCRSGGFAAALSAPASANGNTRTCDAGSTYGSRTRRIPRDSVATSRGTRSRRRRNSASNDRKRNSVVQWMADAFVTQLSRRVNVLRRSIPDTRGEINHRRVCVRANRDRVRLTAQFSVWVWGSFQYRWRVRCCVGCFRVLYCLPFRCSIRVLPKTRVGHTLPDPTSRFSGTIRVRAARAAGLAVQGAGRQPT